LPRRTQAAFVSALFAFVVVAILSISGSSSAHLPIYQSGGPTEDTALKIPDANVSYGITAEFTSSTNRIQFYAFSVEAGQVLDFELSVPAMSSLENFAPVVLLIGPDLPVPEGFTAELIAEFDIALASGSGATSYLYNGTENVNEFEPFTQVNLWTRQKAEVTLPSQAMYYVAIAVPQGWAQDATSGFGKYIFAPGVVEKFALRDYMAIPLDWIRWHAFWGQSVLLFMLPTFSMVIIGTPATWYYVKKRRPEILQDKPYISKAGFYLAIVGAMLILGSTVNQLALLFGYTRFSLETADYIEFMLQAIGLVLGIIAFRMAFSLMRPKSTASKVLSIALLVVIGFSALTVGAGWLIGPVLFACAGLAELLSANRPERKTEALGH
jgi:hypothetical protein